MVKYLIIDNKTNKKHVLNETNMKKLLINTYKVREEEPEHMKTPLKMGFIHCIDVNKSGNYREDGIEIQLIEK